MDATHQPASVQRARWAIASMFFINGFIIGSWAAQIPEFVKRLAISESTFGLMILLFGVGGVLAMACSGYLMAKLGSRSVLLPAAAASVIALLLLVSMQNVWAAAAAMVAFGVVVSGMDVAMNANAVTVERYLGRAIMSSSHGFWSLGGFAGGAVGGFTIQAYGSLAHAVLVTLVTGALLAFNARHVLGGDHPQQTGHHGKFALPRAPAVYLVGFIALLCVVPEAMARNWAALFMERELGAEISVAGLAFALFSGAMALMRFAGDGVRDRFGATTTFRVSCGLTAAGLVLAGLSAWPILTNLAFAVAGLGAANLVPIVFSAAGNHDGVPPSTGMSITMGMCSAGMLIVPSSMGVIAERTGFTPVFLGIAGIIVVAGLLSSALHNADFKRR